MAPPIYRHEEQPNGNFTIFSVPIFSAHVEERSGGDREFNARWLSSAVKQAIKRQDEGYMAPLHVSHHGSGSEVKGAGQCRMTHVADVVHDGRKVKTIFADLVNVKPEIFERIAKGELVYRSVEILDVDKPEIDSLALLDHETPFFRFPLLRVADQNGQHPDTARVTLAQGGPVLAYSQSGHASRALFNFQESTPVTEPKTGSAPATNPTQKAASAEQVLAQMFQLLKQFMGEGEPEAPAAPVPAEQPAPVAAPAAPAHPLAAFTAPVAVLPPATAVGDTAKNEADGANAAMESRMANMEKEINSLRAERAVASKSAELASAGFDDDQVKAFRARASEHGLEAANAYAAGMQRVGPSDPPSHWTGEQGGGDGGVVDAPEIAAFAAQGPEALSRARDLHASWKRSESPVDFNDYVAINTDPDSYCGMSRS